MSKQSAVTTKSTTDASAWSPFTNVTFTLLWLATLISNIGTWMHDVGAGWLMTTLDSSPAIVSLVQAATTFPIFLFALFAGALADRLDKRKMLIVINVILVVVILILSLLVHLERMTPGLLLTFTVLIGTAAAFMAPAWQAVVPSLVPKHQLQPAIALNSMGVNLSRAIGPALAGILITSVSLSSPFFINAFSGVFIVIALLFWKQPLKPVSDLPPEPVISAMVTGLRHSAYNKPLRDTMVRALGFFFAASSYWALLPLVARAVQGGGAQTYGVLLGTVGFGAVAGALILPRLRRRFDSDGLVIAGTLGTALASVMFAATSNIMVAAGAALLAGISWITVLTCFNVSAQTSLPNWIRARGLAVYMMVFFGSMALGATVWGQVAENYSISTALCAAATLLVLAIPLTRRAKLGVGDTMDLSPSTYWPSPIISDEIGEDPDRGPVMITIEYRIVREDEQQFLETIQQLSGERYRDGAYDWGIYQDSEDGQRWIEWFLVASWAEHLRQHQRVTEHDRDIQEVVRKFHKGEYAPLVKHFMAPSKDRR